MSKYCHQFQSILLHQLYFHDALPAISDTGNACAGGKSAGVAQLGMIGAPRPFAHDGSISNSQYLYFSARSRWLFRLQRSVVGIARDSPSFGNKASRKADLEQRRHLKPESAVSSVKGKGQRGGGLLGGRA
jgi:hypothetical protein